ncbi:hypothetical protein [Streptomyces longispororuber]|uniref:SLAC1 family transporter n=1 Tax=Streptomyces longispororuber TaxID=68230 RepID=UPI003F561594
MGGVRHRWCDEVTPAAGACTLATGVISVGLHLTGHEVLSRIFLVGAALLWLLLAADLTELLVRDRTRWPTAAITLPALTAVAATAVVGTRFSVLGWQGLAIALLVLAAVAWPVALVPVVRHWRRRGMPGEVFLACVATQALAVLAATLCWAGEGDWLGDAALACFALGLVLYGEALVRFDVRQVLAGAGDQWVAGGALAVSALAGARLTALPQWTGGGHDALRVLTYVLLGLALAWYALLLAGEVAAPRPRYDARRWATVFALGLTAAAALSAGLVTDVAWLRVLGRVLLWVAVAAWGLVRVGFVWPREAAADGGGEDGPSGAGEDGPSGAGGRGTEDR